MASHQTDTQHATQYGAVANGLQLSDRDQAMLAGECSAAEQMAMRILTAMARVYGAERLLDICSVHVDSAIYHGRSSLDFANRLLDGDAKTCVPTTLNVGGVDLLHPEHHQGPEEEWSLASELMEAYIKMGCRPIWTCTPYQVTQRPKFGMQIAWAESNAIVFANSVLGARTNRYGDYIDICAAITGRAPQTGLHISENRRGQVLYKLENIPDSLLAEDVFYPIIGYFIGANSASKIPAIEGLPLDATEDQLKALGAAAASSGAVALFHAIGVTPEAQTAAEAFHNQPPEQVIPVSLDMLRDARQHLSTVPDGPIDVVALGSPHFSIDEFAQLVSLLAEYDISDSVDFIVCTNRFTLDQLHERGWYDALIGAGIRLVVDTCVVVMPIVRITQGTLMTNSGKFAHYTPGNTGLNVVYGSLRECVASAAAGVVTRDASLWAG